MSKKIFLILILFSISLFADVYTIKQYVYSFKHITSKQKEVMCKTYNKGKQFNLGYTLTAIAYQESKFGKIMFNTRDGQLGSYGVFHNLIESVYDRYVYFKPTNPNSEISIKLALAKRLVDDYDFSFSQALAELKFWQNACKNRDFKNQYFCLVTSYNGGWKGYKKRRSKEYYQNIINIIKALKIINIEKICRRK